MSTLLPVGRLFVVLSLSLLVGTATVEGADKFPSASIDETELIAVLASEASPAEKAITCKQLAIYGSSKAVPQLAKLLTDKELASWARIALEAIPGSEADKALRDATKKLDGLLLVGVINSIGVGQDAEAVGLLTEQLRNKDPNVASASAVALGHIGGTAAAKPLRAALATAPPKVRSAVAEGCILCAEKLHAEGQSAEAVEIYDEVREADVPRQRLVEATRGAMLARGPEGVALLTELCQSSDEELFEIALSTAREFPEGAVDQALADELSEATPERAALLIHAMADRPRTVILPAVLQAASQGPKQVRAAAVSALARVGDETCLPTLLEIAVDDDDELSRIAKETLADLPGEQVNSRVLAILSEASGNMRSVVIETVARRRIEATPTLLQALENSDPEVRSAALLALGETIPQEELPVLISQVVSPKHSGDQVVAEKALRAASVRMPNREACAAELASALEQAPSRETKIALLNILGAVGGPVALETIGNVALAEDRALQDAGTRLLGEWMSPDVAPVLLRLSDPDHPYHVRAQRGYLRIARQMKVNDREKLEICRNVLDLAPRDSERELVLEVLKRNPSVEALKLAESQLEKDALGTKASESVVAIAEEVADKNPDAARQAAQHALDTGGDDATLARARELLKK